MRKELWIGGSAAALVHGGAILLSLLRPGVPVKHPPGIVEILQVRSFPPPPPELVEPQEEDPAAEQRPNVDAPPSLNDVIQINVDAPFVQPIQPPPDSVGPDSAIIIPMGPLRPRSGPPAFDLKDLSQPPVATSMPSPTYPFALRREGVEGQVVVDFIVDEKGNVSHQYALEDGRAEFRESAVEGIRRWHFRPGMKDGRAVRTHMQVPLVFNLRQN